MLLDRSSGIFSRSTDFRKRIEKGSQLCRTALSIAHAEYSIEAAELAELKDNPQLVLLLVIYGPRQAELSGHGVSRKVHT